MNYYNKTLFNINLMEQSLQVKELPNIERDYPTKKREKNYPERYDYSVFEKLNEMNTNIELQNDYKKWKDGINYKTNRKINIGGKIHNELKQKFMIDRYYGVLFDTLNNINAKEYLQETEKNNKKIDVENVVIKDYNKLVDSIIEQIQRLEVWNEFIEFEGKFYGITSKVLNNIHLENDCFGEMVFMNEKTEYYSNDRPFGNCDDSETTYLIYKCNKCNYENKIVKCITGGWIGTTGFSKNYKGK
jgi:hypothetical protein